jgi:hypothetical protein
LYIKVKRFRNKVKKTCNCRKKDYAKKDGQKFDDHYYKYNNDQIKSNQYTNDRKLGLSNQTFNLKDNIDPKHNIRENTVYYEVNPDYVDIEEYNK